MSGTEREIDKFSFICGVTYCLISVLSGAKETTAVVYQLGELGVTKARVLQIIEVLKSEGHIFEPKKGFLKTLYDSNMFRLEEVGT